MLHTPLQPLLKLGKNHTPNYREQAVTCRRLQLSLLKVIDYSPIVTNVPYQKTAYSNLLLPCLS